MRWFAAFRHKQLKNNVLTAAHNIPSSPEPPGESLAERMAWFRTELDRCSDIVFREFTTESDVPGAVIFLQGMVDLQLFEIMVENGLLQLGKERPEAELAERISGLPGLPISSIMQTLSLTQALQLLLEGQMLLLLEGLKFIQIFPLRKVETRALLPVTWEMVEPLVS